MKLYEFSSGDTAHKYKKSIVICFKGKRNVLSTGPNNGGRIGDPASWHEKSESSFEDTTSSVKSNRKHIFKHNPDDSSPDSDIAADKLPVGTINILLYIDANLSKEAMASALVSCTEAKVAAMQELLISSRYSCGIATGTGTDGTIIISNAESQTRLTNAGKHSKLVELIGRTVISSIKEALKLQQGITPQIQHDIIRRMERFGVTEDALWDCYKEKYRNLIRAEFTDILDCIRTEDTLVTYSSLYAHLLDQLSWGLLSFAECRIATSELLKLAGLCPDSECGTENIIENYILAIDERIHRESVKKK